jgi:hypothetical protein
MVFILAVNPAEVGYTTTSILRIGGWKRKLVLILTAVEVDYLCGVGTD